MHDSLPYEAETQGVVVRVRPAYLAGQSDPDEGRWVWAYQVEIENRGDQVIQLMARRWIITDATGHVETVRGPGVVGEQPVIAPGSSYDYVSGCPLTTPTGQMRGSYRMIGEDGSLFDVAIPRFPLVAPAVQA